MANTALGIGAGYKFNSLDVDVEHDLVRRAQDGDSDAFGRLYVLLIDPIYRYIFFRVTDTPTAEDLTSKVFLKAWEHLPRYRFGGSPFRGWLYTIAHNVVVDHYRTCRQTTRLDDIVSLASNDPAPEERFQFGFDVDLLRRALQTLTRLQREVITLRFISDLGTEEIAGQLGKSAGAVRALQMRAMQGLTKVLQASRPLTSA